MKIEDTIQLSNQELEIRCGDAEYKDGDVFLPYVEVINPNTEGSITFDEPISMGEVGDVLVEMALDEITTPEYHKEKYGTGYDGPHLVRKGTKVAQALVFIHENQPVTNEIISEELDLKSVSNYTFKLRNRDLIEPVAVDDGYHVYVTTPLGVKEVYSLEGGPDINYGDGVEVLFQ